MGAGYGPVLCIGPYSTKYRSDSVTPMSDLDHETSERRDPLNRERILASAIAVADTGGVGALTIRTLATNLGVTPMSVYHYFANKSEILDGIVDVVFSEIDLPPGDGDWQAEIRRRAQSAPLSFAPLSSPRSRPAGRPSAVASPWPADRANQRRHNRSH